MRVGVTGANGFVGSHLVAALCAAQHEVRILVRPTSNLRWLQGLTYTCTFGDMRNSDDLDAFVENLDILIHCAALTTGSRQELNETNTRGTVRLLESLKRKNPHISRFVFISSQEVAGINNNVALALDEGAVMRPITDYGRSKLRAEALIQKASSWLTWTILRPSPVYGPRDKDTFLFFQAAAARLKPVAFFPGKVSLMYVENLVQGILKAMVAPRTRGQVYFLADEPAYSWSRLTSLIESATVKHRLVLPLGKTLLFVVTAVSSAWSLISGTRVIMNRQKYLIMTAPNLSVHTGKAQRDFGFSQTVPTAKAMHQTYLWYRSMGWL